MFLLTKPITVKNKHGEVVTIDPADKLTWRSRVMRINTKNPQPTRLASPHWIYTVNERSESEFYIDEHQLKEAFVQLPKAETGKRYRVLQDTTRSYRLVNSSPLVKSLPKGSTITCQKDYVFTLDSEQTNPVVSSAFNIEQSADDCYYGAPVYYDPAFYEPCN